MTTTTTASWSTSSSSSTAVAAAAATGTTTPDRAHELTATAKTKDGSQGGQEMDKQREHFYAQ